MRLRIFTACCVLSMLGATLSAQQKTTPADKAETAYEAASSRYSASKYQEAADLFDEFVAKHSSSSRMPGAYMRLAHCRWALGEFAKAEMACDEVIRNNSSSRFWYYAQGLKLVCLRDQKLNDKYFDAVQAMLQKTEQVPLVLEGFARHQPRYPHHFAFDWPWDGWYFHHIPFKWDWSTDVLEMADTPERASRALKLLDKLFTKKAVNIPLDWQHAHLCLLRKSGDAPAADKTMKDYILSWNKDARVVSLYVRQAEVLRQQKDAKAVDAIWEELLKDFTGYGNLDDAMRARVGELQNAGRGEESLNLVKMYLRLYPISNYGDNPSGPWAAVMESWLASGIAQARKGNQAELKDFLVLLDEVQSKKFPRTASGLHWRLRACVALQDAEGAGKIAEQMLSDATWSAANFSTVAAEGRGVPAVEKVIEATRVKRKIPVLAAGSPTAKLLGDLKTRLAAGEERFAEEIAAELFDKHRNDAATIAAVAAMAEHYYKKVLAEPRDKWMNRMVEAYPQNPSTQTVLLMQVAAEQGQRKYDRVAAVCDTGMRLFPGTTWSFFNARIEAYKAAQDIKGLEGFVRGYLGDRVRTEVEALNLLHSHHSLTSIDRKTRGDAWLELARSLAGSRGELYCQLRAFGEYWPHSSDRLPEAAKPVARWLRSQQMDGQIRWSHEFAEAGILAWQKQGSAAARMVTELLGDRTDVRDLYGRCGYGTFAAAMTTEKKPEEGLALVKKIKGACPAKEDQFAADWLEGMVLSRCDRETLAAKKYFDIVQAYPFPGQVAAATGQPTEGLGLVLGGLRMLGNTPERHSASQKWIKELAGAQDVIPDMLYTQGMLYLSARQLAGVTKIRGMLADKYAASRERDLFEDKVQATLNPPKKPPAEKKP